MGAHALDFNATMKKQNIRQTILGHFQGKSLKTYYNSLSPIPKLKSFSRLFSPWNEVPFKHPVSVSVYGKCEYHPYDPCLSQYEGKGGGGIIIKGNICDQVGSVRRESLEAGRIKNGKLQQSLLTSIKYSACFISIWC